MVPDGEDRNVIDLSSKAGGGDKRDEKNTKNDDKNTRNDDRNTRTYLNKNGQIESRLLDSDVDEKVFTSEGNPIRDRVRVRFGDKVSVRDRVRGRVRVRDRVRD
jgi:hypothetical protein